MLILISSVYFENAGKRCNYKLLILFLKQSISLSQGEDVERPALPIHVFPSS